MVVSLIEKEFTIVSLIAFACCQGSLTMASGVVEILVVKTGTVGVDGDIIGGVSTIIVGGTRDMILVILEIN